ncbi:MAG TPA: hypothetical protein HPP83_00690 [Candidatus Hydrogenedentes bacterium]|nr:hypothetical protein [Candidatus Hydrogenedentota bacterium]
MNKFVDYEQAIAGVCREVGVVRLDLFGSITKSGFGPESDVDVLARFDRRPGRMFGRYFELKERLEEIFGRPVDVVIEDAVHNPYFREALQRTRVRVYEA